jgi:hypothetical protein
MPRRFRVEPHHHPILIRALLAVVVAMILVAGIALIRRT